MRVALAILCVCLSGCAVGYVSRPDGTRVFVGSVLKDTQIGDVDLRERNGTTEFHLKGYDARAKAKEAAEIIGLALRVLVLGVP